MRSMATGSETPQYLCVNQGCGIPLQPLTFICPTCRCPQYRERYCVQCRHPFPQLFNQCSYCYHYQNQAPTHKQCVLCGYLIPNQSEKCWKCCVHQDFVSLQLISFKECCNILCKVPMILDLNNCYVCDVQQSQTDVTLVQHHQIRWRNPTLVQQFMNETADHSLQRNDGFNNHVSQQTNVEKLKTKFEQPQNDSIDHSAVQNEQLCVNNIPTRQDQSRLEPVSASVISEVDRSPPLEVQEVHKQKDQTVHQNDEIRQGDVGDWVHVDEETIAENKKIKSDNDPATVPSIDDENKNSAPCGNSFDQSEKMDQTAEDKKLSDQSETINENKDTKTSNASVDKDKDEGVNNQDEKKGELASEVQLEPIKLGNKNESMKDFQARQNTKSKPQGLEESTSIGPTLPAVEQGKELDTKKKAKVIPQTKDVPRGFSNSKDKDALCILFRGILPKSVWNWDEKSKVYMRFGSFYFGEFKYDFGPGEIERVPALDEQYLCVKFHCYMKSNSLKAINRTLSYKYMVYSSTTESQDDAFEFLHGVQSGGSITNRLIEIPWENCRPKVTIFQYDTMIYPAIKEKESSWFPSLNFLKTSAKSSVGGFDVPLLVDMQELCCTFYFSSVQKMVLAAEYPKKYDLSDIIASVIALCQCCYEPKFIQYYPDRRPSTSIKKVIINLIKELVLELEKKPENTTIQMCGALIILAIDTKLKEERFYSMEDNEQILLTVSLLAMIGSSFSSDLKEFESFKYLIMKKDSSKAITIHSLENGFKYIATNLKKSAGNILKNVTTILKVLPYIHFLRSDCKPHQKLMEYSWIDYSLRTGLLKTALIKQSGFVQATLSELKPLLKLDPLLAPTLLYICPKEDLPLLCDHVQLNLFIAIVFHNLNSIPGDLRNELETIAINPLMAIQKQILEGEEPINMEVYKKELKELSEALQKKLRSSEKDKEALKIFCLTVLAFSRRCHKKWHSELIAFAQKNLKLWLEKIMNGGVFGGEVRFYSSTNDNLSKEIKIWNYLLNEDAAQSIREAWLDITRAVLQSRISMISKDRIVELLCKVDSYKDASDVIVNLLMDQTSLLLDDVFEKNPKQISTYMSTGTKSIKKAQLLGKLLTKRYPKFSAEKGVILTDVLDWNLWPGFLKLNKSYSKASSPSQEWEIICTSALSLLESVCGRMKSGNVSMEEIEMLKSRNEQLNSLCSASLSAEILSISEMRSLIERRENEYVYFLNFQTKLSYFIDHLKCNSIGDLNVLKKIIERSTTRDPISTLCISHSEEFTIACYQIAKPLFPYVENFYKLSHDLPSILFRHCWNFTLAEIVSKSAEISFQDVITLLWEPILSDLNHLFGQLKTMEIKLSTIDEALKVLYTTPQQVYTDLNNLNKALSICFGETLDTSWVGDVSDRISKYWDLCSYNEPAKAFLKFRDALKLTGDFGLVEKLAQGVASDENLKSIDQKLVDAGRFLKSYAANKRKKECLEVFVECQKIVEWIRMLGDKQGSEKEDTESNVNDLQNFVNIALATAAGGEGDYNTDRLVNLRIIGSGFGQLIYKLPQDAGYETLQKLCTSLWVTLEETGDLPDKMRSCEDEIDWYKSIRETQGSVEKTSFGQMRNINQLGVYQIGSIKIGRLPSRYDAIRVRLRQPPASEKVSLPQFMYNLDELRDLESKLVLIAGPESSEREEVDKFLDTFHSVCRIADVLMELQHHGNTEYIKWNLRFSCCMPRVYNLLAYQAKKMEYDLSNWLHEVKNERNHFYELNYFTTPQLLGLREELGCFETSNEQRSKIEPNIMNLLHGISEDLFPDSIKGALDTLKIQMPSSLVNPLNSADASNESTGSDKLLKDQLLQEKVRSKKPISTVAEDINEANYPKPKMNVDDLTQDQSSHLYNLVDAAGYNKLLILLAFERIAPTSRMLEDVSEWCGKHEYDFDYPDEDTDSEADSETMSDDESTNEEIQQQQHSLDPLMDDTSTETDDVKLNNITEAESDDFISSVQRFCINPEFEQMIEIKQEIPLDEQHPDVKKLIGLGFEPEKSIEAVDKFPNDPSAAMEYILSENDTEIAMKSQTGSNKQETVEVEGLEKIRIEIPDKRSRSYMSLSKLGRLLQKLTNQYRAAVSESRSLPEGIKEGECNLLVVPKDHVLKTTLSLYMESSHESERQVPLPTNEEVLICTERTTIEEVTLLWKRAFDDPGNKRIFCLVNADLLVYQVCDKSLHELQHLSQNKKGYKIVIICSKEEEEKSNIISKLQIYRRPYQGIHSDRDFSAFLKSHFIQQQDCPVASLVDKDRSRVRILSSDRAGMGKSLYIKRLVEKLSDTIDHDCYKVVPVHGPKVDADKLVQTFKVHLDIVNPTIFHIDISQTVLRLMDSLLFNLLILRTLSDSKGQVWRVNPIHLYVIEVTVPQETELQKICKSTIDFLKILPTVKCESPKNVLQILENEENETSVVLMDEEEFKSSFFQRVFQNISLHSNRESLDEFMYLENTVEGNQLDCLDTLLGEVSVDDPSWSELKHFVSFLNEQLKCSELSVFCNKDFVHDTLSGFKTFVVRFMILMSKEFCTSSLKGEVALETGQSVKPLGTIQRNEIIDEKKWHRSYHPYLFFNKDGFSITFVGFNVNKAGDIIDPIKKQVIQKSAIKRDLYEGLQNNGVKFDENYHDWDKPKMIEKLGMVMGIEHPVDPDPSYVLTADNVIKIFAIQMKFRCNIPVVIMGETGCGKTRLIRYMCDLAAQSGNARSSTKKMNNMLILKVHGGITSADIVKMVEKAEEIADDNKEKYGIDTVLFFDEANTTDAIGLIKEVMCDRRLNGRDISNDIKFIAACNPYRKHHDDMISKLESAGLGFYVKATDAQERLGEIPLRQLVYRVFDLPASMRPLIYDFGKLDDSTENEYTKQMVKDRCSSIEELADKTDVISAIANVLTWSQSYMKKRTDECSFVSLRDVERTLIVFKDFFTKRNRFLKRIQQKSEAMKCIGREAWALIMSLSVCYHARLQDRQDYETEIVNQFKSPLDKMEDGTRLLLTVAQFKAEIKWCQDIFLDNMKLGPNIARNAALRENVFMMAVCIQLRIPLFLVGKPGSSKSLAKSIIADSLNRQTNEFLKDFNEVHMFSYQCSQLSTPESVIEVFHTAKRFQEDQKNTKFTSVVVLDEVGLAEDSPNLPLKALHPLLEDGTEGTEDQQIIAREKRVAFIGISNWALDPAKMNRGVMVTRGDPNDNELKLSAEQICSSDNTDEVKNRLKPYFTSLANGYIEICEKQKQKEKAFFGLRDFYSLIKMLYWMCKNTDCEPTEKQLEHAIKRNFGGLAYLNTFEIFQNHLKTIKRSSSPNTVKEVDPELLYPDCSPLGLIEKSLLNKETSQLGENRYLLFLTENYAALQVLQHKLHEAVGISKEKEENIIEHGFGLEEVAPKLDTSAQRKKEPFVLFGSSFPKDREYTQVCRNINQIKICMETGRTVILLNLENLYESLYDLLNQYYILLGKSRYVDLGLQTHRVKCRVDNDFKLILIAEKDTVYKTFPTPLINRLEKHFVLTETILLEWQENVLMKLKEWVETFSNVPASSYSFKAKDTFVGFQDDTPAAVIFQVTKQKREKLQRLKDSDLADHCNDILAESKEVLLQMASPDSLIRLQCTALKNEQKNLCKIYFEHQKHDSLIDFMENQLKFVNDGGISAQVTTHSHLLSSLELNNVRKKLGFTEEETDWFLLQEFDTELDFTKAIHPSFSELNLSKRLLIIQSDSGHIYGDLIACARYRIDDEREKFFRLKEKTKQVGVTHVLFIIHLPRHVRKATRTVSFVGFQGGSWISSHIDDIHTTSESGITLNDAISASISQLFYNKTFNSPKEIDPLGAVEEYVLLQNAIANERVLCTQDSNDTETDRKLQEQSEGGHQNEEVDVKINELVKHEHIVKDRPSLTEVSDDNNNDDDHQQESIEEKDEDMPLYVEDVHLETDANSDEEEVINVVATSDTEENSDKEEAVYKSSASNQENDADQEDALSDEDKTSDTMFTKMTPSASKEEIEKDHVEDERHVLEVEDIEEQPTADEETGGEKIMEGFTSSEEVDSEQPSTVLELPNRQFFDLNHQITGKDYTQCRRLHFCIQSVIAMIAARDETKKDWAAKRVKLLLELIPKDPQFPLGIETFYGALVRRILLLLKEREEVHKQSDWVLREACDGTSLQTGGTFQNVLARKIDAVIIPIFANILSFVDSYNNLEIIRIKPKQTLTIMQRLWLRLFNHPAICVFSFFNDAVGKSDSNGFSENLKQDFACQFPFFWAINELIVSQWDSVVGSGMKEVHFNLYRLLLQTPLAEALCIIPNSQVEAYCQYYLHDFLQLVHHTTHSQRSLELEVLDAVLYAVMMGPNLCYSKHQSLLSRILAVHVVYWFHQKEIMWLGQLTSTMPGIIANLKHMDGQGYNSDHIDIHLHAVRIALNELELPLDSETKHAYPERHFRLQTCQNIISSILEAEQCSSLAIEQRQYWNYVRMINLYVEHVALEYPDLIVIAKRYEMGFKCRCDFSKVATLKTVQLHLNAIEKNFCKESKSGKKAGKLKSKTPDIRKRCEAFFSEVISTLCFGHQFNQPEPELVAELINMVFDEQKQETKQLGYSTNDETDSVPVMRSFLLQLLLEYNIESVMRHLNNYLHKSRMVIKDEPSICLLCIQCLEDAIFKNMLKSSIDNKINAYVKLLTEGKNVMINDCNESNITVEYLEGVAKIRFVCFSVTELLYKRNLQQSITLSSPAEILLLQVLQDVCKDLLLNSTDCGPGIYFMKQIARQHGISFLGKISAINETQWVIPAQLRKGDKSIEEPSDPLCVYNEYRGLKELISDAIYSKQFDKMEEISKTLNTQRSVAMLVAVYQIITMRYAYPVGDPQRLSDELRSKFLTFIRKSESLNKELKKIGEILIDCSHCDKLTFMKPSFDQSEMLNRRTTEVVVHAALVFQAREGMDVLKPFLNLLTSPKKMKNAYLPTCPGSMLNNSIKAALGGAFNKCPKGHPYFIDVCGDLTTAHECPKCGIRVPEKSEESISKDDNKLDKMDDAHTGYLLGNPDEQQAGHQIKERNLSPTSCAILRALINTCLTWAACVNENATEGLIDLLDSKKLNIPSKDLPTFFWKHLENNIRMLGNVINKNEDDACLVLHAVLKQICTGRYPNSKKTKFEAELGSEDNRAIWENSFDHVFIQPIISEVTGQLGSIHAAMSKSKTQERDPIHYAIYEKVAIPPKAVIPRLWTYRPRITTETFFQELQMNNDRDNNPLYPILYRLSENETMLRATQYLPELVKLQQFLCQIYHRKINRLEANDTTVAMFIENIKSKSTREDTKRYFQAVKCAWDLVKNNLSEYSRIGISDEYIGTSWEIETLPLVYLIPSLSGPGVCTNALLEALVQVHNGFIDHFQFVLKRRQKSKKKNVWAEREVLVKHVQHCHLVEYQQQLLSMVLSHCHYSLKHGEQQELTYEFAALEKHFIDRFVHGKPRIKLQIPEVRYLEESYSIANIKRIMPSQDLSTREKSEIIVELKTMQSLRDTLDIVEIIMGFVSSGKYDPNMKLRNFVSKFLKMEKRFASKKALEYCNLEHMVCLWKLLSVEMAKRLLPTEQEPFVGLDEKYLLPLDQSHQQKLYKFLQNADVEEVLHSMFEFIEAFVKHSQDYVKSTWELIEALLAYSDDFDKYQVSFPKGLLVGHAVAIWKEMATFKKTRVA